MWYSRKWSTKGNVIFQLPKCKYQIFIICFSETEILLNYIHHLTKYTSEYTLTFISKSLLQSMYELASSMRKQFHQIETRDQEIEEDDSSKEMRSNSTFFGTLNSLNGIYDVFIQLLCIFTLEKLVCFDRKVFYTTF